MIAAAPSAPSVHRRNRWTKAENQRRHFIRKLWPEEVRVIRSSDRAIKEIAFDIIKEACDDLRRYVDEASIGIRRKDTIERARLSFHWMIGNGSILTFGDCVEELGADPETMLTEIFRKIFGAEFDFRDHCIEDLKRTGGK